VVAADRSPSLVDVVATDWTTSDKYAGHWLLWIPCIRQKVPVLGL